MIFVSALCIGVIYPIFLLFNTKILGLALMGEILLGILAASFAAVINAFMYKAFSAPTRYSGSAFSYGIGGAIGGATSIMCSYLIYHTNNKMIPALYITVFSIMGLLFSLLSKRFFCKN